MTSPTKRLLAPAIAVLAVSICLPIGASANSAETGAAATSRPRIDRTIKDVRIDESSGLARSAFLRSRLWTHNDSGGGSTIYALGRNGRTAVTYELPDVSHRDWEGMARAKRHHVSYLFVGDIGDNGRSKDTIFVTRVKEPRPGTPSRALRTREFELNYPDGSHDAETLMVRPGSLRIFIVTKGHNGESGAIYRAPKHPSTKHVNQLQKLGRVSTGVTDGAFLKHGRYILRGYPRAYLYSSIKDHTAHTIDLPSTGESITSGWRRGYFYIGSERRNSNIWRVPLR